MPDLNFYRNHRLQFLCFLILLISLTSCEDPAKSEARRKQASQALSNREIKRVTEQQLLELAIEEGNGLARIMQKDLNRAVNQALIDKKIASQNDFDQINQLNSMDTLAEKYNANIQMLSFKNPDQSESSFSATQRKLLQQYQEGSIPMSPTSEMLSNTEILYVSPIILNAQPRGMWSVIFTRKYLVYQMDVKAFH